MTKLKTPEEYFDERFYSSKDKDSIIEMCKQIQRDTLEATANHLSEDCCEEIKQKVKDSILKLMP